MRPLAATIALASCVLGINPAAAQFAGPNVGGSIGGAFGTMSQHDNLPPPPASPPCVECGPGDGQNNLRGILGGGGIGYNWQNGALVYGLALDFSFAGVDGSSSTCGVYVSRECGGALRSLGTARGLVGWSYGNWMPYVTGGYGFGDVHAYDSLTGTSGSKYRGGWTIGGGIEAILSGPWSAKLEYLYVDLGKGSVYDIVPGVPEYVSTTANVVRVGLNYRFAAPPPPAPVVGKYYGK